MGGRRAAAAATAALAQRSLSGRRPDPPCSRAPPLLKPPLHAPRRRPQMDPKFLRNQRHAKKHNSKKVSE